MPVQPTRYKMSHSIDRENAINTSNESFYLVTIVPEAPLQFLPSQAFTTGTFTFTCSSNTLTFIDSDHNLCFPQWKIELAVFKL